MQLYNYMKYTNPLYIQAYNYHMYYIFNRIISKTTMNAHYFPFENWLKCNVSIHFKNENSITKT